jgi:hypothetical protein
MGRDHDPELMDYTIDFGLVLRSVRGGLIPVDLYPAGLCAPALGLIQCFSMGLVAVVPSPSPAVPGKGVV